MATFLSTWENIWSRIKANLTEILKFCFSLRLCNFIDLFVFLYSHEMKSKRITPMFGSRRSHYLLDLIVDALIEIILLLIHHTLDSIRSENIFKISWAHSWVSLNSHCSSSAGSDPFLDHIIFWNFKNGWLDSWSLSWSGDCIFKLAYYLSQLNIPIFVMRFEEVSTDLTFFSHIRHCRKMMSSFSREGIFPGTAVNTCKFFLFFYWVTLKWVKSF